MTIYIVGGADEEETNRNTPPNEGMQVTANSVRFSVAPVVSRT